MDWFDVSWKAAILFSCVLTILAWKCFTSVDRFDVSLEAPIGSGSVYTFHAWKLVTFMNWSYVGLKISFMWCFVFTVWTRKSSLHIILKQICHRNEAMMTMSLYNCSIKCFFITKMKIKWTIHPIFSLLDLTTRTCAHAIYLYSLLTINFDIIILRPIVRSVQSTSYKGKGSV